ESFTSAGAECLVVTPSRENPAFIERADRLGRWEQTQQQIIDAAKEAGCAYASLGALYGPGAEGATGLSPMSYASGNLCNHPGLAEFSAIGEYLSLIFRQQQPQ